MTEDNAILIEEIKIRANWHDTQESMSEAQGYLESAKYHERRRKLLNNLADILTLWPNGGTMSFNNDKT